MKISIRVLYVLSAVYLVVPLIIFAFGWLRLPFALSLFFGFLYLLYQLIKSKNEKEFITISFKEVLFIFFLASIWTLISGAGHRGFTDGDGYKHNAILNDLISLTWPVVYHQFKSSEFLYLCYYIAYYLPAAAVGKLLGWKIANIFLFIWTVGGVSLSLLWLLSLYKKGSKIIYAILFMGFAGLDMIGRFIMRDKVVNGTDWEWWARNWQYSGNTTLLFYVPQHALVGWILMGVLAYGIFNKKPLPFLLVLLSCVPLWSPFVFLGLLPFTCIYLYQNRKIFVWGEWLLSALFLSYQLLYFGSNLTFLIKETGASAWLWQIEKLTHSWALLRLFLFYLFEFGIFAFFIFKYRLRNLIQKFTFTISVGILLLLPWYKMGLLNDFVMRVSIPALWVIGFFWIESLVNAKWNIKMKIFASIIFILASVYPLILVVNGIHRFSWGPPKASLTTYEDPTFRKQYLGSGKSIFFTYFSLISVKPKVGQMKYE